MLVGNKRDLAQQRVVERAEAAEYAKESGLLFMETSAKSREDVDKLFLDLAGKLTQDKHVAGHNGIRPGDCDSEKHGKCCK